MNAVTVRSFADLLRRHRRVSGLTQEELADRTGLSVRGISDLERGARTTPRKDTVTLLADALGLTGDDRGAFLLAARRAVPLPTWPSRAGASTAPTGRLPASQAPQAPLPPTLPCGTVTLLFTSMECSTRLLQQLGDRYPAALNTHQALLRAAFASHSGCEVEVQEDAFIVAFARAPDALAAAADAQRALAGADWPGGVAIQVRMGLHTGSPTLVGDHYVGPDVHRAAHIVAAGHNGQVLISETTAALVRDMPPEEGAVLRDLGAHRLTDWQRAERLYQLTLPGLPAEFPPLETLDGKAHNVPIQLTLLIERGGEVE